MVVKTFKVSYQFMLNQCYLIYDDHSGILVDPAWDFMLINDFLIQNQIALKGVLLTHAHPDHTDLAEEFALRYDVPVLMSAAEIDHYQFNCVNLEKTEHLDKIYLGNFEITAMLTPGHTSGSLCYFIDGHVFSGDTVFMEGVGICEDADQMFDSVQFLKSYLPKDTLFWPGHSFGVTPGKSLEYLLQSNIYFQFENRKHFIEFRTRKNQPDHFSFR